MTKRNTIGFFPTLEGKPGVWCEWEEDGRTTGQICYASRANPVKLESTYGKVRSQIERTKRYRRRRGYDTFDRPDRYDIERVTA